MELPKSNDSGGSTDATQQRPGNAVIIIGAGAAGLMAAYALSAAGVETILLEAADAPGGRIRTLHGNGFTRPVEAGAEFVHGDLPLTLRLLKEAGIPFHKVGGKMISVNKGVWGGQLFLHDQWDQLMVQMSKLKKDLPLAEFLSAFFGGEKYAALRDSVERYAGGFDLADPRIASTLALYKEWNAEDGHQHRIDGGYERLINYLADQCRGAGCALHFSAPVKKIEWARGRVVITTAGGMVFTGGKVIITVSVGVLQLSAGVDADGAASGVGPVMDGEGSAAVLRSGAAIDETGSATAAPASVAIQFLPAIPDHLRAAGQLGYGTVTKFLVEFRQPFWNKRQKDLGFIVSDEAVPTWWTQAPDEYPLLTGWLPG
ncbi:MAG TPA: FAD-dependent oxidoreductase, partial [Puia sp.]|nr:FAD-dependent oxidoreductase [Puia sp.]